MFIMKRREKRNNGRNTDTKLGKHLLERRKLQISGNIGSRHHQTNGDKRKSKTEEPQKKKILKIKLYDRNIIKRINTLTVFLVSYSRHFLNWTKHEKDR